MYTFYSLFLFVGGVRHLYGGVSSSERDPRVNSRNRRKITKMMTVIQFCFYHYYYVLYCINMNERNEFLLNIGKKKKSITLRVRRRQISTRTMEGKGCVHINTLAAHEPFSWFRKCWRVNFLSFTPRRACST